MVSFPLYGEVSTWSRRYWRRWKNTVAIVVLANTPEVCANIIDGLANGKYVIILRNLSKGADGSAEPMLTR